MFIISKHSALSSTRQDVFLILTASAAVPPRTQSAAQLPSLAPHDSKARLRAVTSSRDSWRSHVHRARLRSACSYSSYKLPMGGVKGQGPLRSLGGTRGIFSHVREYPPYFGQRRWRCPPPALSCRKSKSDGFFSRRFSICITAKPFCCRGWPSCAALC